MWYNQELTSQLGACHDNNSLFLLTKDFEDILTLFLYWGFHTPKQRRDHSSKTVRRTDNYNLRRYVCYYWCNFPIVILMTDHGKEQVLNFPFDLKESRSSMMMMMILMILREAHNYFLIKWQWIGVLVVSSYLPDNNSKIKYLLWKWQKVVLLNRRHWTIILVNSRLLRSYLLRSLHRDLTCSKDTNFVCTSWKIRKTDFDRIQKTKTWIPLPYFCKMFVHGYFFPF